MFLLNPVKFTLNEVDKKFTIQNVPIKFERLYRDEITKDNLQYRMFLLNLVEQSVQVQVLYHLQYRMFLLNVCDVSFLPTILFIYNTECSY